MRAAQDALAYFRLRIMVRGPIGTMALQHLLRRRQAYSALSHAIVTATRTQKYCEISGRSDQSKWISCQGFHFEFIWSVELGAFK